MSEPLLTNILTQSRNRPHHFKPKSKSLTTRGHRCFNHLIHYSFSNLNWYSTEPYVSSLQLRKIASSTILCISIVLHVTLYAPKIVLFHNCTHPIQCWISKLRFDKVVEKNCNKMIFSCNNCIKLYFWWKT